MNLSQKPKINPSFTAEKFDSELLLYNEAGSRAFYLNDSANAVLALCREDLTVGQIIECLKQTYPEHENSIANDVTGVLEMLVANEVIELSDE